MSLRIEEMYNCQIEGKWLRVKQGSFTPESGKNAGQTIKYLKVVVGPMEFGEYTRSLSLSVDPDSLSESAILEADKQCKDSKVRLIGVMQLQSIAPPPGSQRGSERFQFYIQKIQQVK